MHDEATLWGPRRWWVLVKINGVSIGHACLHDSRRSDCYSCEDRTPPDLPVGISNDPAVKFVAISTCLVTVFHNSHRCTCHAREQDSFPASILTIRQTAVTMKPWSSIFDHLFLLLLISRVAVGYNNGLARTPQMGWNTWNRFGCDIDEELIVESAKVMADRLKVYGYECTCHSSCI